jgi:hypothetical protein
MPYGGATAFRGYNLQFITFIIAIYVSLNSYNCPTVYGAIHR